MRWLVIVLALTGCGDNRSATQRDAPPHADAGVDARSCTIVDRVPGAIDPAIEQACTLLGTAKCERLQACSSTELAILYPDLAGCEREQQLACIDELVAPNTGATAMQITKCASDLTTQPCAAFLSGTMRPPSCMPEAGTVAYGGACTFASQCQSAFCAPFNVFQGPSHASNAVPCGGTCQQPPSVGSACTHGCGLNLVCAPEPTSPPRYSCSVPLEEFATCIRYGMNAGICGYRLHCFPNPVNHTGSCLADISTLGGTCWDGVGYRPCNRDLGLVCDVSTPIPRSCVALVIANVGESCGGTTVCGGGATCVGSICVAPIPNCQPCDTNGGATCEAAGVCVPIGSGTAGICRIQGSPAC